MFRWLGLSTPLLWGVMMALLSVIPVLGSFVIWGLMANRGRRIRIGSINRCWRSGLALSGANHALDVVGPFGGEVRENASISARLRLFPASGALA